jgi:glyoxylase I family protein
MERVTGIGGVFFRANDPLELAHWYRDQLGVDSGVDGESVWRQEPGPTVFARRSIRTPATTSRAASRR